MTDLDSIAGGIRSGDRRALARGITFVESTRADHRRGAEGLLERLLPYSGSSIRLGVSGSPGVGKSTFIEAFGLEILSHDHRVAVLAVDPSSTRSGGSILGDKTRMVDLNQQEATFIRPSPSGGTLGGVARRTREAMLLCEAAGFDVIIVETVGVGQSEVAVAEMVDLFLVLVAPGGGDQLQGIKRGIMELVDLLVVNKADGELKAAATRAEADYAHALHLMRPIRPDWSPQVLACSALERRGIAEIWSAVEEFRDLVTASGAIEKTRADQAVSWMWAEVRETLMERLRSDPAVESILESLEAQVRSGTLPPTTAARQVLTKYAAR